MRYKTCVTLAEYMEQHQLSDAALARRAGLTRTQVWQYRTKRRQPRAANVDAIEKATNRKVRAEDLKP